MDNPFTLDNDSAYQAWRKTKLADYPARVEQLQVAIADPGRLTPDEHAAMLALCRKTNMVVYSVQGAEADKDAVHRLGEQFGLCRLDHNLCAEEDGLAALQVSAGGRSQEYIPYSDRPINWHTDGYYNTPEQQVRGLILHCVRQAEEGGDNACLDHEIAYLLLRDANPDYVAALMQPEVMTIPPNFEDGVEIRAAQSGPVFSVQPDGTLHMRYTARGRNIQWQDDPLVKGAVDFLQDLFRSDSAYIFRFRMKPNQGLVCNNVVHNRSGFRNGTDPTNHRLLYRGRYYDRISGT